MSGRVALRRAAARRPQAPDAGLVTPFFHRPGARPELGGSPSLLTFSDADFVSPFLEGAQKSGGGWDKGAWRALVPMRDWSEPPAAMFDASGGKLYDPALLSRRAPLDGEVTDAAELAAVDGDGPRWLRKLYLPLHQHFHIVSAELVCDRPERPPVDPARVVAAGAVVRRLAPGGAGRGETWEDWIVTGKDRGLWVHIASPQMSIDDKTVDPEAVVLPTDSETALALARVAGGLPPGPAQIASTRMMPLPPIASNGRTVRFAYLSVQSGEKEIPVDPAKLADARVQLQEHVGRELDAQIAPHISAESDRLATEWDALILALQGPDVNWATGGPAAGLWGDAPTVSESTFSFSMSSDAVDRYNDERADATGFRRHLIEAVRQAATRLSTSGRLYLPSWNGAGAGPDADSGAASVVGTWIDQVWGTTTTQPYAHRREFGIILRRAWGDLLAEARAASLLGPSNQIYGWEAVFAAALTWVRAHRINLVRTIGDAMPGPYPPLGVYPESRVVKDPHAALGADPVPVLTVGSLSAEIDAWIAATDGVDDPALTFGFTLASQSKTIHLAAGKIEARASRLLTRGASAGGGFQAVIQGRIQQLRNNGVAPRRYGLDLSGQPELGLLVFPTPGGATLWSDLKDEAVAHYNLVGGKTPAAVLQEADARQMVVRPRFDPDHLYAVWCWARVRDGDPCVQERVVWSRRTEPFSLAEPLDLLGLKPAPMRLPDLPKLLRDLPRVARAGAAPYAVVTTPPDSGYTTGETPADSARQWGLAWVCSFGIPVFTLCAWILFSIIFSILVIIPGFMWMLLLKICIPVPVPRRAS